MKMAKEKESGLGKGCNNEFDDKDKWNLFFYGAGFVIFLSLVLYLWEFNSGLSNNHTKWGEFGSYFGGITGPLISVMAFIGLLKSISLTKSQFEIQSQESTFFNLLNFHTNKVDKIYSERSDKADAFKYLCEEYGGKYNYYCISVALNSIVDKPDELPDFTYFNFLKKLFGLHDTITNEEVKITLLQYLSRFESKQLVLNDITLKRQVISEDLNPVLVETGRTIIRKMSCDERVEILRKAFDIFYDEYGHISGSYIRNIYYILSHSNESNNGSKYAKIFRAQLSRHELALIYFNISSSYCNPDFINLIEKFDILNGLYISDLCYNPSTEMYKDDLEYIFSSAKKIMQNS